MRRSIIGILTVLITLSLSVGWETSHQNSSGVQFGKIYIRDNLLLVSELTKGIRLLDITSPASPRPVGFVQIDGNNDMAAASRGVGSQFYLYADSYRHLVVYDVSNPQQIRVVDTVFNVFQQAYDIGWGLWPEPRPMTELSTRRGSGLFGCSSTEIVTEPVVEPFVTWDGLVRFEGASSANRGRGGSMARFAVVGDYLYCIDFNQLHVFEIRTPDRPRLVNRVYVGWGIETLFPLGDYLFIGGQNGMFVYSRTDPKKPEFVSVYEHVRACDPVVVEDTLAYVTLRGGPRCGTAVSGLYALSIKNLLNPKLIGSYSLPEPMGLDVYRRIVYVCDDSSGVRILDASNPSDISEIGKIPGENGYDAIHTGSLLIVSSRTNLSFYSVTTPSRPALLGRYGG